MTFRHAAYISPRQIRSPIPPSSGRVGYLYWIGQVYTHFWIWIKLRIKTQLYFIPNFMVIKKAARKDVEINNIEQSKDQRSFDAWSFNDQRSQHYNYVSLYYLCPLRIAAVTFTILKTIECFLLMCPDWHSILFQWISAFQSLFNTVS